MNYNACSNSLKDFVAAICAKAC